MRRLSYGALADDAGDDNALAESGTEGSEADEAGAVPAIGVVVTTAVGVFGAGLSGTLLLHAATVVANMIEASISLRMANSLSRGRSLTATALSAAADQLAGGTRLQGGATELPFHGAGHPSWGLVRHYWVVAKLLLTTFATTILLLKLAPVSDLSKAAQVSFSATSLPDLEMSLLVHPVGDLVILLIISVLAIYKPAGLTRFAARGPVDVEGATASLGARLPRWVQISLIVAASLAIVHALLVLHGGHGPEMHLPVRSDP